MKAIDGNLPIDVKYDFLEIIKSENLCKNCGMPITNVVLIKNQAGIIFEIGTECAESVLKYSDTAFYKYYAAVKAHRREQKFILDVRKGILSIKKEGESYLIYRDNRFCGFVRPDFFEKHETEFNKPIKQQNSKAESLWKGCYDFRLRLNGLPVGNYSSYPSFSMAKKYAKNIGKEVEIWTYDFVNGVTGKYTQNGRILKEAGNRV